MPSVAQEEPLYASPKKRRRDDDDDGAHIHLQFSHPHFHNTGFNPGPPRKILPIAKRSRLDDDASSDHEQYHHATSYAHHPQPPSPSRQYRPQFMSRTPSADTIYTPDALQLTTANNSKGAKPAISRPSAPCHICHRRPTKKSIEQDDFGDCQSCGERACFICIRQCAGWRDDEATLMDYQGQAQEHRQIVCSRCCVERGVDGDVVCLGCLPFVEG